MTAKKLASVFLLNFVLATEGSSALLAQSKNFVREYLNNQGVCGQIGSMVTIERDAADFKNPFGKNISDWTEQDLSKLLSGIYGCVGRMSQEDMRQTQQVYSQVRGYVNDLRRENQQREMQIARRIAEEQRLKDEQRRKEERSTAAFEEQRRQSEEALNARKAAAEAEAVTELQSFFGHLLSDAEIERVKEIGSEHPSLSGRVDGLLEAQAHLKAEGAAEAKRASEKTEAARKIALEQNKRELAEHRAAEEASLEAERKQEEFVKSLPLVCKRASSLQEEMADKAYQSKAQRADSLAEAGDTSGACETYVELASRLEDLRKALVECTKSLENNEDAIAQSFAKSALDDAIGIHQKQKAFKITLEAMKCSR